jgi:hypothetical protein
MFGVSNTFDWTALSAVWNAGLPVSLSGIAPKPRELREASAWLCKFAAFFAFLAARLALRFARPFFHSPFTTLAPIPIAAKSPIFWISVLSPSLLPVLSDVSLSAHVSSQTTLLFYP